MSRVWIYLLRSLQMLPALGCWYLGLGVPQRFSQCFYSTFIIHFTYLGHNGNFFPHSCPSLRRRQICYYPSPRLLETLWFPSTLPGLKAFVSWTYFVPLYHQGGSFVSSALIPVFLVSSWWRLMEKSLWVTAGTPCVSAFRDYKLSH